MFWWTIPCKAMTPVIQEFSKLQREDILLITGELSSHRKKMGWEDEKIGNVEHIVLKNKDEWRHKALILLEQNKTAHHVFNGFYEPKEFSFIVKKASDFSLKYTILTEAPSNKYRYLKWYLAEFYHRFFLSVKYRRVIRNAMLIGSLSGYNKNEINKFLRLGVSDEQLFPFGYFSSIDHILLPIQNESHIPRLFCPGNLVRHKGVDILINALDIINQKGIEFICHITGDGPEKKRLIELTKKKSLNEKIIFHHVLKQSEYNSLKSQMDILIAPGYIEPWGIRINESIQAGHVIIVSDLIGASELVSNQGGKIFKSGDFMDLAIKLEPYLINQDLIKEARKWNIEFSQKISPKVAASYLHSVIHCKIENDPIPTPIWRKVW